MVSKRELLNRARAFESISKEDYEFIIQNKDRMLRTEIARELGISLSKLKRIASYKGIKFGYYKKHMLYSEQLKQKVLSYYESNGKKKTAKRFPEISIRSIVERYSHRPRQRKWKHSEVLEAIKMAGFISFEDQAKFFNRPRAFRGSIVSLWQKKIKLKAIYMHGWPKYIAKYFLDTKKCPSVKGSWMEGYQIFLWSDAENYLYSDCPEAVKEAVAVLAEFQCWLFQSALPRLEIERIIWERGS